MTQGSTDTRETVTVLRGGTLFRDGSLVHEDVAFDSVIRAVGAGLDGDRVVDISDCTVLPGLIDAHIHALAGDKSQIRTLNTPLSLQLFGALGNLRAALEGGTVFARDASGADSGMRLALDRGLIVGPRLKVAIRLMHTTGGYGDGYLASGQSVRPFPPYPGSPDSLFDGPNEARRVVRQLIRAGADVIKVAVSGGSLVGARADAHRLRIRPDELDEIVREARACAIPVMAHAHGAEAAAMAAEAGVTSVEHGTFLDETSAKVLARNGTVLVPTLSASWALRERHPLLFGAVFDAHLEAVQHALSAGVSVAAGSDAGIAPHGNMLGEIDLLRHAGMGLGDAIIAATERSAALLGIGATHGVIATGRPADLVVVRGTIDDSALAGRIRQVWIDGRLRFTHRESAS